MKTRRVIALLVAIMTLVTATASAEWFYAGLDTTDVDNIGRLYNEKIDGEYTNKIKFVPFTLEEYIELVDWNFESYEFAYPHAGYDRLYVDGEAQPNTRYNNLYPQWETKFADYMWEVAGEHTVYQRQMTKIPGYGWVWDFGSTAADEAKVFVPTTRTADVEETFKVTGFANLKLNGYKLNPLVKEENTAINLYKRFGAYSEIEAAIPGYDKDNFVVTEGFFAPENLSAIDANGEYVVSDLDIAIELAPYTVATKWLEGPSYHGEDGVKDVASLYLAEIKDGSEDWAWDADTVANGIFVYDDFGNIVDVENIEISWTNVDFEATSPYEYYQCLVVNGIVFDGTKDAPRVYRLTSGIATPDVEWKYISLAELRAIYEELPFATPSYMDILEWKHINGEPVYYTDGQPVLRVPTGEYAKCYVKVTDTHVQLWRVTGRGADELVEQYAIDVDEKGGYAGFATGAVWSNN